MTSICTIDSQAWATLAAGAMAVGAALFVANKQNQVLRRQADIEALKVRSDLFNRRFATYEATAQMLAFPVNWEDETKRSDFVLKVRESQFLFSRTVYDEMTEIFRWVQAWYLYTIQLRGEAGHITEDSKRTIQAQLVESQKWLLERLGTVHKVFEADLKLSMEYGKLP